MLPPQMQRVVRDYEAACDAYEAASAMLRASRSGPLAGQAVPASDLMQAKLRLNEAERSLSEAMEQWRRSL